MFSITLKFNGIKQARDVPSKALPLCSVVFSLKRARDVQYYAPRDVHLQLDLDVLFKVNH